MSESTASAPFSYEQLKSTFKIEYPRNHNFAFDVIDKMAVRNRNHVALIWVNENGHERKLTFWELSQWSNKAANFLQSRGIEKGDRVMVMLQRIPEWWIVMLALMKVGAVSVPSAMFLTQNDITYRCRKGQVAMVITDASCVSKFDSCKSQLPTVETFVVVGGAASGWVNYEENVGTASRYFIPIGGERQTRITDPMVMYFTSGTTGFPKIVVHDYTYALAHRVTAEAWHDVKSTDIQWTITDTGWAKIAWGAFFGQWIVGATIFAYEYSQFRPDRVLAMLERYGITVFCAPPSAYRRLILEDLKKYDLSELRRCTSAGEPLNPEVIEVWKREVGRDLYEGYGQTESVMMIGTYPGMKVKNGSMGLPAPIFDIDLVGDDLRPVPPNEIGEIAVRVKPNHPRGLFRGYLDDPELTARVFRGDWYLTGDRAFKDEDGYFWFVGRSDDIIKSSGYRIGPFEVESVLIEHPAVVEAAVVGVPDKMKGQRVKAFVVLAPNYIGSEALVKELQDHVRKSTAPFKCPKEIEFVHDLPKTISAKIRRVELREREVKRAMEKRGG